MRRLLIPTLTEPPGAGGAAPRPQPGCVDRLLRRGDTQQAPVGVASLLCRLTGIDFVDEPPAAALSFFGEFGTPSPHYLFHAEPVRVTVDMSRVSVHALPDGALGENDARDYVDAFNTHFADRGVSLDMAAPQRWYLAASDKNPTLRTSALTEAAGRHIDRFLPRGPDAGFWRALINETQMLFAGLEVTDARQTAGRIAVGGIWIWGGGRLPDPPRNELTLRGESPLLDGIARLSDGRVRMVDDQTADVELITTLDEATRTGDRERWDEQLAALQGRLDQALRASVVVSPCAGTDYIWRPMMRWRFWR